MRLMVRFSVPCRAAVLFLLSMSLCVSAQASAWARDSFSLALVDKTKHLLHLAQYNGDRIEIIKSYHATLGKAPGDKTAVNDLKTPEGIYFFTARMAPPAIKKKFGLLAIMMDYPNPVDRLAGKTGYDIMLHATDDPSRLLKDRDSEGCVVIGNDHILEVSRKIRLGLTPIIIYPELKPEYLQASFDSGPRQAFERWIRAWSAKDTESYIGSYAGNFRFNRMDLKRYREYKESLNRRYEVIRVKPQNVRFFHHPKYDLVMFTQNYESTLRGGGRGFVSTGTKILYFVKENGQYRIAAEEFTRLRE